MHQVKKAVRQRREHKMTIPQPFQMTLREATKPSARSRFQSEPGSSDAHGEDEIECLKKFRANLVPGHTFLPLYDDMVRADAIRRQARTRKRREETESAQQPFNFVDRRRSRSATDAVRRNPNTNMNGALSANRNRSPHAGSSKQPYAEFRAENELLRELRIKTRAERLLKESALPTSIKENQERQILKRQLLMAKVAREPMLVAPVRAVHRSEANLPRRVDVVTTAVSTERRPSTATSVDTREVALTPTLVHGRRRSRSLADLRDAAGFIFAPRMNETTRKRDAATRIRYWGFETRNHAEHPTDVWGLKQAVARSVKKDLGSSVSVKVLNLRKDAKLRNHEYLEQLKQIVSRVKKQPLLIDRQTQMSAKNNVEKKFKQSLENHGLDVEFVLSNSNKANNEREIKLSDDDDRDENDSSEDSSEDVTNEEDDDESQEESEMVSLTEENSTSTCDEELEKIPERDRP